MHGYKYRYWYPRDTNTKVPAGDTLHTAELILRTGMSFVRIFTFTTNKRGVRYPKDTSPPPIPHSLFGETLAPSTKDL